MTYKPGQVSILWPFWPKEAEWFLLGGPGLGSEAQEVHARYPHVKCAGFEPHPELYAHQRPTFPGLLLSCALWSSDCRLVLKTPNESPQSSSVCRDFSDCPAQERSVRARSLDSLSRKFKFRSIVLWLDVEEAEYEVILGARRTMEHVPLALLETNDRDRTAVDKLMASYGLKPVAARGRAHPAYQDVVYARS